MVCIYLSIIIIMLMCNTAMGEVSVITIMLSGSLKKSIVYVLFMKHVILTLVQ